MLKIMHQNICFEWFLGPSSGAFLGFLAMCTSCYCGTLCMFGIASWVMLCVDTTTKERLGRHSHEHELDCEAKCDEVRSGEWGRTMGQILCGPLRLREH